MSEWTELNTTAKLSSRINRRRLTIAALVLLALGGGLWWSTRPQIDPRLVGTWFRHPKSSGPLIFIFHGDGRMKADGLSEIGTNGGYWTVRGDSVCLIPEYRGDSLTDLTKEFLFRTTHRIQYGKRYGERQFRIVKVGDGQLRIQPPSRLGMEPSRVQTFYSDLEQAAAAGIPKSEHSPVSKTFEVPSVERVFDP